MDGLKGNKNEMFEFFIKIYNKYKKEIFNVKLDVNIGIFLFDFYIFFGYQCNLFFICLQIFQY